MRYAWFTSGLMVTALAVAACSAPSGAPGQGAGGTAGGVKTGGVVKLDFNNEPTNLNPMLKSGGSQQTALGGVYTPLLRMEFSEEVGYTGSKLLPYMAESWEVSPDAKTYTFKLRQDLKWQPKPPVNGRAITAEDIKYNILRFRDENVSMAKFIVASVSDVETPDPYTVRVLLAEPSVPFLPYMGWDKFLLHPKELVEAGTLDTVAIGSGPFMLESWDTGIGLKFKKNPNFFLKDAEGVQLPYLDGIEIYKITDPSTSAAAFVSGQVDLCGSCMAASNPLMANIKQGVPNAVIATVPEPGGTELYLGNQRPPFDKVQARQALRVGLDTQAMIKTLTDGKGFLNVAGVSTAYKQWALPEEEVKALYPGDLNRARQLLRESGYTNPKVQIIVPNNDKDLATYTEFLISQMRNIGFDAEMVLKDFSETLPIRRNGEFQMLISGKSQEIDPDGNLVPVYHSKGTVNYGRIRDPQLDELLLKQRTQVDPAERKATIQAIVRRIAEQAYELNPVGDSTAFYWRPYVKGYYPHIFWGMPQKLMTTWLDR